MAQAERGVGGRGGRRALHLGAEYTLGQGETAEMDELVPRYCAGKPVANRAYYDRLLAQVECVERWLGSPFVSVSYADVSAVRVPGGHTATDAYRDNVRRSVPRLRARFAQVSPQVVIVAGAEAFRAFRDIVVPELADWSGLVVRVRNPGAQGHRGRTRRWLRRYAVFPRPPTAPPVIPTTCITYTALTSAHETQPFRAKAL